MDSDRISTVGFRYNKGRRRKMDQFLNCTIALEVNR